MKKAECEKEIRRLCHEWADEIGFHADSGDHPSFTPFKAWLGDKGEARYLDFKSTMGPDEDAELWFDQELGQMWHR